MANIDRILRAVEAVPWAIQPEKLETIAGILVAKAESGQIPSAGEIEAAAAAGQQKNTQTGGIAVLHLLGTISRRMGMLDAMSGGASIEGFSRAFDEALNDASISSIVIVIHSPGGSVYGVEELSRKIYEARSTKRIVAIADNLMASAAYYIGSAADELVVTPSGEIGSIGVYTMHFDWSAAIEKEGVKVTLIKAGEHKAEGNPYEPLADEALAHMQSQVDDYYDLFINSVARNRGVSPAKVRADFGKGRTMTAQRAVAAGMADRVGTVEEIIDELRSGKKSVGGRRGSVIGPTDLAAASFSELNSAEPGLTAVEATAGAVITPVIEIHAESDMSSEDVFAAFTRAAAQLGLRRTAKTQTERATSVLPSNEIAVLTPSPAPGGAAVDSTTPPEQTAPVAREVSMENKETAAHTDGAANTQDAVAAERQRGSTILTLAREHSVDSATAERWVADGLSVDQVRENILSQVRGRDAAGTTIRVGADREADREFNSLGEQLVAIRNASANPGGVDRRLLSLNSRFAAASGSATNVPSDGGFVIQPQFVPGITSRMWEEGRVLSRTNRVPIGEGSNALVRNVIKETSRATGSRYGGVRVYRAAEAATVESSKPKVTQQRINLDKLMGIYYATDEVLQDAMALTVEAERGFRKELTFVAENEIFRGNGAGECFGFLNSPALVVVAKESGQAAATIKVQNIAKMLARLPAGSYGTAAWFINPSCIPQLVELQIGTTPVFVPGGSLAGSPFGTLMGLPILPVEYCEAVGTQGDIVLADLAQYTTIDKRGITWSESVHVRFIYDESAFKITYRFNGQPDWPESVTPFKGSDKISPFIALAERA